MFRLIKSTLLVLFLIPFSALSQQASTEQPAFISDALFVYVHSGPSNQYRILGTVNAGSSITYLGEDSDTGYAHIQYDGSKDGWLPKEFVTFTPGLVSQLEQLNAEYAGSSEKIMQLEQQREQLNSQLNQAISERQAAIEQLETTTRSYEQVKEQLASTQTSVWQKPMVLGSLILLAGLVFGLLLPLIIPKRRNSERWM